jgi:parvulin-like peptidyl-prolyl isomerase
MKVFVLFCFVIGILRAEPTVVAKIGDIEIGSNEIRALIAALDPAQQDALAKDPAAREQYLRALLVQRVVLKQAVDQKWDQDPEIVSSLMRIREAALVELFLKSQSLPETAYPSAAELRSAYDANKADFLVPRTYLLAQIYISADQAKLDATLKLLKEKDADFAAIARKNSDEVVSAAKGGEIGWLAEDQIQPEIRAKLPALMLNTVSEPIRLSDGWHILKVLDIREANTPTFDQIREPLAAKLRSARALVRREEYLSRLLRENPIAINEIELEKIGGSPIPSVRR